MSGRRFVLLAGAFVLAVVVVALVVRPDDEPSASLAPSSAPRQSSLAALVGVSDAVVIGRVLATDAPDAALLVLGVDEVVVGDADLPEEIVVEQPGWLSPSSEGDIGIWFLVQINRPDADPGGDMTYAIVNEQGRYVVDPDDSSRFVDVPLDDPLVDELEAQDPTILRHQVQEAG